VFVIVSDAPLAARLRGLRDFLRVAMPFPFAARAAYAYLPDWSSNPAFVL